MAIYVDNLRNYGAKGWWCHLMTDGDIDELHGFAESIGLKRHWFQPKPLPHYDLRPSKRTLAIRVGAMPVTSKEMIGHYLTAETQSRTISEAVRILSKRNQ